MSVDNQGLAETFMLCFVSSNPILPTKQKCLFHPLSHSPSEYFWSIQTPSHQVSRTTVFFWEEPRPVSWNICIHHKLVSSWPCCLLQVRASHTSKEVQVSALKPFQAFVLVLPLSCKVWAGVSAWFTYSILGTRVTDRFRTALLPPQDSALAVYSCDYYIKLHPNSHSLFSPCYSSQITVLSLQWA